jgi:hypothetical protein
MPVIGIAETGAAAWAKKENETKMPRKIKAVFMVRYLLV